METQKLETLFEKIIKRIPVLNKMYYLYFDSLLFRGTTEDNNENR